MFISQHYTAVKRSRNVHIKGPSIYVSFNFNDHVTLASYKARNKDYSDFAKLAVKTIYFSSHVKILIENELPDYTTHISQNLTH